MPSCAPGKGLALSGHGCLPASPHSPWASLGGIDEGGRAEVAEKVDALAAHGQRQPGEGGGHVGKVQGGEDAVKGARAADGLGGGGGRDGGARQPAAWRDQRRAVAGMGGQGGCQLGAGAGEAATKGAAGRRCAAGRDRWAGAWR